jgi:hypothetical protein
MAHLLAMTKPLGGTYSIEMGETLYQFTSRISCLEFCDAFATHFPHTNSKLQLKVVVK